LGFDEVEKRRRELAVKKQAMQEEKAKLALEGQKCKRAIFILKSKTGAKKEAKGFLVTDDLISEIRSRFGIKQQEHMKFIQEQDGNLVEIPGDHLVHILRTSPITCKILITKT